MSTHAAGDVVLLDDGEFYVELSGNHVAVLAAGFLQHRCYVGVTTPDGYECVGSFDRDSDGKWSARIDMPYDPRTNSDSRVVAKGVGWLDAIVALWMARREANCRHRDG